MSDLIDRRMAIGVLLGCTEHKGRIQFDKAVAGINKLPPAQPERIVRCKDCKHFKQVFAPNDNNGLCGHWHSKYDARTSREGYCSHAERKEVTE